jgi:SAM-dependent methyltransferase
VDNLAQRGFSRSASEYARARPGFPPEALDWLAGEAALEPGAPVIELGAGTGLLTRDLLERGLAVTAVEPLAEMREELGRALPGLRVVDAVAEELPLPDDSATAVVAANALHWFHLDRALPEIHRVLEPGGSMLLLWTLRDTDDPLQAQIERLNRRLTRDGAVYPSANPGKALAASEQFEQQGDQAFKFVQHLDRDGLADLARSWSVIGQLEPPAREEIVREVVGLAGDQSEIDLSYRCWTHVYRAV